MSTEKDDEEELSPLEAEFRSLVATVGLEINSKAEEAAKLWGEARRMSDEHGIPINPENTIDGYPYIPYAFTQRFSTLDLEFVEEITGVECADLESGDDRGSWSSSSIGC